MLPPPLAPRFPTILVGRQLGHLPAGPRLVAHGQWQPQGTHGCWGGALPPRVGRATPPTLCPPAGDTPGDVRVQPGLRPGLGPPRSAGERGGLGEPGQAGAGRGSWLPRPGRSSLLNSYCLNPKGGCYVLFPFRAGAAGSRASRRGSLPVLENQPPPASPDRPGLSLCLSQSPSLSPLAGTLSASLAGNTPPRRAARSGLWPGTQAHPVARSWVGV